MQTETLYGSRGKAVLGAVVPFGVAVVLFVQLMGDSAPGSGFLVAMAFAAFGIFRAGDLFKPRQLVLDREGFVLHPSFGAQSDKIGWKTVQRFEIKGGSKNKHLVCYYLADDHRTVKTMKLGTNWCLNAGAVWGEDLEKVQGHLTDYHRGAMGQAEPVHYPQRPAVVASKISQPAQPAATTRSGVVYAEKAALQARPVTPSLNGETKSIKGLGVALLAVGAGVAALSVVPFVKACHQGLCQRDLWDMGDYRIWLFAALWTVCLLAVLAGGMILSVERSDRH